MGPVTDAKLRGTLNLNQSTPRPQRVEAAENRLSQSELRAKRRLLARILIETKQ